MTGARQVPYSTSRASQPVIDCGARRTCFGFTFDAGKPLLVQPIEDSIHHVDNSGGICRKLFGNVICCMTLAPFSVSIRRRPQVMPPDRSGIWRTANSTGAIAPAWGRDFGDTRQDIGKPGLRIDVVKLRCLDECGNVGKHKELAPHVSPAQCLDQWHRIAIHLEQPIVAAITES